MAKPRAQESRQVEKVRKKLRKLLDEEHKQFTPEKLQETSNLIRMWLGRHSEERINIKGKVGTFDENRHSKGVQSKFVRELLNNIESEYVIESLRGKITHHPKKENG